MLKFLFPVVFLALYTVFYNIIFDGIEKLFPVKLSQQILEGGELNKFLIVFLSVFAGYLTTSRILFGHFLFKGND